MNHILRFKQVTAPILLLLSVLAIAVMIVCLFTSAAKPEDDPSLYEITEEDLHNHYYVSCNRPPVPKARQAQLDALIERLENGMVPYTEIVSLIGKAGRSTGHSYQILEWELHDGSYLYVAMHTNQEFEWCGYWVEAISDQQEPFADGLGYNGFCGCEDHRAESLQNA